MTPSAPEIMLGVAAGLQIPPSPDAGPDYFASRVGLFVMLASLAAQEANTAAGAAITENAMMRTLFKDAAAAYDDRLGGALAKAAAEPDPDLTLQALDAANARLRRTLIALHEAVEDVGDAATDRAIIALYARMAAGRRL